MISADTVRAARPAGPVRDLVGYGEHPPVVRWPNDARVAISLVINIEEGSEVAVGNGDDTNERALAEVPANYADPSKRDEIRQRVKVEARVF